MAQSLEDRKLAVRLLLASRWDYLPDPNTATGILQRDSGHPGPAPSSRVPCPNCHKTGRVNAFGLDISCPVCEGSGWRKRKKGEQEWDEYLDAPVRTTVQKKTGGARDFRIDDDVRRLNAEIARLDLQLHTEDELGREPAFKWEIDKRRQFKEGSYASLARALYHLAERSACTANAVRLIHSHGADPKTNHRLASLEDLGVTWLAQHIRGEIRVPAHLTERAAKTEKVLTVAELEKAGAKPSQIALILGVSLKKTKRLLKELRHGIQP